MPAGSSRKVLSLLEGLLSPTLVAVATALVFLAFGVHVALDGAWERRTLIAMTLRTLVWVGIAAMAWRRSTAHALATREH